VGSALSSQRAWPSMAACTCVHAAQGAAKARRAVGCPCRMAANGLPAVAGKTGQPGGGSSAMCV
jgi:hypothetical protein